MHLVLTLSGMLLINIHSNIWSCAALMVWFLLRVVWREKEQGYSITHWDCESAELCGS